jgi:hypothetical protein
MPFHAQCLGCSSSAYVDCLCPAGFDPAAAGFHVAGVCPMANPDAEVVCPDPAKTGCCPINHDHAAAANACPGGHGACPEPADCRLHAGIKAQHVALRAALAEDGHDDLAAAVPEPGSAELPHDCPGGHCHKDLPDCTGCRPLIITAMPGSATIRPVTGG